MTKKKRGLGKGISVLLADNFTETEENNEKKIQEIKLESILPNKYQPRQDINDENIEDLARSIDENGIIQPIIVRSRDSGYEIIAGERRFRASKKLGLKKIPCIIRDIKDDQSAKLALIENIQREDLNIVEEAKAFKKMLDGFDYTQNKLSKEVGKSRSYIANTVRILDLAEDVLELIVDEKLSVGHGKVLLAVKDLKEQKFFADIIVEKELTVRETEKLIRGLPEKRERPLIEKDEYLVSLENDLMMSLGTKVNLVHGKDKGVIEIEYYGEEDLDRILELIK